MLKQKINKKIWAGVGGELFAYTTGQSKTQADLKDD